MPSWHNSPTMSSSPSPRPQPLARSAYKAFQTISTRWADNDVYGHINNVVYYAWFDTAVNAYLIEHGALELQHGDTVGLVVQTHCDYFSPLSFPQPVHAGLRVGHVGASSVRYEVGIFAADSELCAAHGHFVHVYVDRVTRRPTVLPEKLKTILETLKP